MWESFKIYLACLAGKSFPLMKVIPDLGRDLGTGLNYSSRNLNKCFLAQGRQHGLLSENTGSELTFNSSICQLGDTLSWVGSLSLSFLICKMSSLLIPPALPSWVFSHDHASCSGNIINT